MVSPIKFDNILNFRDVGQTINVLTNTSTLQPNLLYRSARPDTATPRDRSILTDKLHIKTILDLRSKTEHINVAKAHYNVASLPPAVPDASKAAAAATTTKNATPPSLTIPTIEHNYISLNGPAFERHLVRSLPYLSLFRLISLLALGYRDSAIAILGTQVMVPRGLIGLGIDTLDYSTREIKTCFDILCKADSYPVLVHCTQGKDRTGLIILLVLLLCGVNLEAAEQDYVLSEKELEPEREERLKDIKRVGLDESFAGCPPEFVADVVAHLNERYGGAEKYLAKIGVGDEAQRNVREIMLKKS